MSFTTTKTYSLLKQSGAAALAVMLLVGMTACGPKLEEYKDLLEPRIHKHPAHNMLTLELIGDPKYTTPQAMKTLFKTFHKLPEIYTDVKLPPRARWPRPFDLPRSEWLGVFALPVSNLMTEIPVKAQSFDGKVDTGVRIKKWEYGEMGEVLHVGSYDAVLPTINRLTKFIDEQGYKIVGDYEEIYLKGPGLVFDGDTSKYMTIIRYQVAKK